MAAAVLTDQGMIRRLTAALNKRMWVRLFRNDIPVLPGNVLADYEPALFPSYADIEVTGLWSTPAMDATGRAFSIIPNITWTRGPGGVAETDYGWVLYEDLAPDSVLWAGRRLTHPFTSTVEGQTVMVSIVLFVLRG